MKASSFLILLIIGIGGFLSGGVDAKPQNGIDPQALIERLLAVDAEQKARLHDVVLDAEMVEGKYEDDVFVEKVRYKKKVYVRHLEDTALLYEEYLECFEEDKQLSEEDCAKRAAERKEKKAKRGSHDVSFSLLKPFHPDQAENYSITYEGITTEEVDDYTCHQFRVEALKKEDNLLNGDFYFESESFHLVRVDFSPAKLIKKMMFKLKKLNMSVLLGPAGDGFWLPKKFEIEGQGKAAFFFGVKFAGTEYYTNPVINGGIDPSIFETDEVDK